MIEIISVQITNDLDNQPITRAVDIIISNGGGASYLWGVGGLPLTGDLQSILNAREAELWTAAVAGGKLLTVTEKEGKQGPKIARAYFSASPAAVAFVRLTPAEQATQIDGMTLAQLKTVVKYLAVAVSVLIKREFLNGG